MALSKKDYFEHKKIAFILTFVILVATLFVFTNKPSQENFDAPGKDWQSSKKVEDYFMEKLRMSAQEATEIRTKTGSDGRVNLRVNNNTTLEAVVSNLYYYGFIKDKDAFLYALENTKDTTPNENSIKVGKTGTIDTNAEFRISENMTAWEIAYTLLNKPSGHFSFDEYNYFFMP